MTVIYDTVTLSNASPYAIDHGSNVGKKTLVGGGVSLQGSTATRRAWEFDCFTEDHAEIDALVALKNQRLTLTVHGTTYTNVMIDDRFVEQVDIPGLYFYSIGFIQETV